MCAHLDLNASVQWQIFEHYYAYLRHDYEYKYANRC